MELEEVQRNWNEYGKADPLWAVLAFAGKEGNRWDEAEFFATGAQEIEAVLAYVQEVGLTAHKGHALDFGCGVGRLTQALAAHFEQVSGVDIAPSMIERAGQYNRCGERVRYYLNDKSDLRLFASGTFDMIVTIITLQHCEPRFAQGYLREFMRLLAPGGILVFQLPSEPTPKTRIKKMLRQLMPKGLRRFYRTLRYGKASSAAHGETSGLRMEMHGIPKAKVISLLEAEGGKVQDCRRDIHALDWVSYRYCVVKAR
jgi:ubiquinone/menaquinone biosynthesis C-methylase UbiE